jgi:hypothetical protein
MGAESGFTLTAPDARYGDIFASFSANHACAARYVAGTSGLLEVASVGFYCAGSGTSVVLGIFTHDAAHNCPGTLVANSTTDAVGPMGGTIELWTHTYGTKPQLTGGDTYWIGVIGSGSYQVSVFNDIAGTAVYRTSGLTYPTLPTDAEWEAHVDQTDLYSFYAVYAAVGGASALPVIARHYRQRRS